MLYALLTCTHTHPCSHSHTQHTHAHTQHTHAHTQMAMQNGQPLTKGRQIAEDLMKKLGISKTSSHELAATADS